MKKVLLIAAVAGLAMVSCKKDYTCTCTTTSGGYTASASVTAKMKKKDAKTWCEGYNVSTTSGGTTSSTTCSLD